MTMDVIIHLWRWRSLPGRYFCISTKSKDGKWKDRFFERDKLGEVAAFVRDCVKDGCNVYFCPHGFEEPRRRKEYAVLPPLLWADLDEVHPRPLRKLGLKPTIAIRSSPGRYVGLWLVNRPVTESLNKRLTYHIGADKGGWDVTQVLRMPGTRNFKYPSAPSVRLLWDDGPDYQVQDLRRRLKPLPDDARRPHEGRGEVEADPDRHDPRKVWRKYRIDTDLTVDAGPGKRSSIIWKLGMTLAEKGASPDEVAAGVFHSPAFNSKHGTDRRALDRLVAKVMQRHEGRS